jgi:CO/xanthine dehydrogenase Mo-binding subunit
MAVRPFMRESSDLISVADAVPAQLERDRTGFFTVGDGPVPDSFDKLREAGAVARETLKLAASKKTGVPVAQLNTARSAARLPDGKELRYTELATIAATLEPVSSVTLREPSQWRLIGKPVQRTTATSGRRWRKARSSQQTNYPQHQDMRLDQCPEIVVRGLENGPRVRGVGEPPVPPAAAALAAAIFAVTGERLREMPFSKFFDFA